MAGTRVSASAAVLAICLVYCALAIQRAHAEDAGAAGLTSASTLHFDVPAQPLSDALSAYGHIAERLVIAPSRYVNGLMSAALNGDYSPREALQRLLAGTGLQASFANADEAIIIPLPQTAQQNEASAPAAVTASAIDGVTAGGDYRTYAAMVQTRLTEALCASPLTRPGSYRLVAQFLLAGTGVVKASRILASTGMPERDAAIERVMAALVLDAAPPASLPEPVTILLRPQGNGVGTDCSQFGDEG
jgi:hypothetical protein